MIRVGRVRAGRGAALRGPVRRGTVEVPVQGGHCHAHRDGQPRERRTDQVLRRPRRGGDRTQDHRCRGDLPPVPHHALRTACGLAEPRRRPPRRGPRHHRPHDDRRDGQARHGGPRGGGQVREGDALVRRPCRGPARRRTPGPRRRAGLRCLPCAGPLPSARRGPRRDAVELPALAGGALRRPRADGGQRRASQARLERPADRPLPGGSLPPRGLPMRLLPYAADRLGRRRGGPARPAGRRRHSHRQRTGGACRRRHHAATR